MLNVTLAGDHLYGKLLSRDVLDEILNSIESVSEGFPTYLIKPSMLFLFFYVFLASIGSSFRTYVLPYVCGYNNKHQLLIAAKRRPQRRQRLL